VFVLANAGDMAQATGWLARAQRLLDTSAEDCVEHGYLRVPAALERLQAADWESAHEAFSEVAQVGERFADPDLTALSRLGEGQSLIGLGRYAEGMALLDEVMVAVTGEEVSPVVAGLVYCAVIVACQEAFDLRRAREWTAALSQWCATQPGLVPYRGQCLVHRSEVMALGGDWPGAMREVRQARTRLSRPTPQPAVGMACYQQGELCRLAGDLARADRQYRAAHRAGHDPQPGLGLLRLAQGRVDDAVTGIRRTMDAETVDSPARSRLLAPAVEVLLAAGDVARAREAADELDALAAAVGSAHVMALAARAAGAVLLAEGDASAALGSLRRAWVAWADVDAPYEGARTRVLMARASRALGDDDSAEMEIDAALWVFRELGAGPDAAAAQSLSRRPQVAGGDGLTAREVEVLRLVATGSTNRAIASELCISEKTVARHGRNIFTKLGCTSRAAATA
jgi:DNA-binding NarL/FixJ family response regulator